ncbi:DNA glycosylase/AP lyase ROS1 isoform X1 [Capsicum annuum]|nr:DNA glycosylase/AP lyase ROS1 isoform X2 [Capsicum annuum]XP_047266207.1 DNA glycosylase/AP lyase ROS1 isoform X2 [Capsicum annuum]
MELGNADKEELEKVAFFTPVTPYKSELPRAEFSSINIAGFNKFVSASSSCNSQKKDEEVSAVIGGRSKFLCQNLDSDFKSVSMAPSTPMKKGNPLETQSGTLDLNERPLKKPKRKKHKPKIYDESKPKKTPKPKIKTSTPKSGKSKASARTKKKLEKDCDKVSDDLSGYAYMQTPISKIPETIAESVVLQVSTPQPEILELAIPATSSPELEHDILTDLGHSLKSCRRALNFNLENENDVISVGAEEVARCHVTHSNNSKFLTNPLDGVNELPVDTNSSIDLEDNLEAESTSQTKQGNDPNIYQDGDRACQYHFLKVYTRRNKFKTDLMPLAGNEADVYQNKTSCQDHFLKVFKRRTRGNIGSASLAGNEAISQNDHKEAQDKDKGWNALNTNTKYKVTSGARRTCRGRGRKRVAKKHVPIAKSSFTISKRVTRRNSEIAHGDTCFSTMNSRQTVKLKSHFVRKVLPTENQINAAMADPESFECVFSLSPIVNSRRKRSIHPKRTKSACREEDTELEPLSLALTLSPLVMCKRKRSKNCKRSTAILDSICPESEISAISGIESFTDKRPQISACNEIQECWQHENWWHQTDKSSCNDIQECPQHEDLWPRSDKSACIDVQNWQQHEDLWPWIDKSACNELQERSQLDDLWPKTECSIDSKSLDKLIQRFEKLKVCDKRACKGRTTTNQKRTSNNTGQLVLRNPFGPIIAHKGKDKPRKKLPKVDIDMESMRVFNLLIENGGEIDEDLDKEKEMWWEEQRKIFEGRAASFIARMRLVLGDRRFSPWKGSVVDSVIGVYLTQNVSDNLSSNAFMLLASAFPLQNKQEVTTQQGQAVAITEGMPNSFDREVSADEKDLGFSGSCFSSMSKCISSTDETSSLDDRNTPECLTTPYSHLSHTGDCMNERLHGTRKEENLGDESTSGSQASVTSYSPEVITFAKSGGDLGNEAVNLPETISTEKNELPEREIDWDELRKTYSTGRSSGLTESNRDSVNWEAVRHADVEKIVEPIKCRGQGNVLAAKIKNCLNRLVEDHGSIDLEWLRDVPTDKVKEYLLSIVGLGPKSVDCIRLLTLRHHSFPVDINVARIAVRLGWVPLQPLPDEIQMHLLEKYPLESDIQKYLWPRLCKLDLLTLYELHYHMITFGKVFCTKRNPNCDACPLRAECRHFASAFASSRLRLPGPQPKGVVASKQPVRVDDVPNMCVPLPNLFPSSESFLESSFQTQDSEPIIEMPESPEDRPLEIIMPESPEHRPLESLERDIEDFPSKVEHEQEIPTIQLNTKEFRENVLNLINKYKTKELQENLLNVVDEISKLHRDEEVSRALVLLNPESASHPARKLKSNSRLRTEHLVYELPDDHPLLSGFEKRQPDDPCPYLLSISLTEQVMEKQKKVENFSSSKELVLYDAEICSGSASNSQNNQIVHGSILIPCRTANRGSFPLNGTYFQVNEVFADHESSKYPIPVARESIWNLRRRVLYCGTSVHAIFRGLTTEEIQYCFWRGFMCVRGYDRKQRAPRPLPDRFHLGYKSKI